MNYKVQMCLCFGLCVSMLFVSATLFGQEKIKLTVWEQFGHEGEFAAGPAMDKIEALYEKAHPNVSIERTFFNVHDLRMQIRVAIPAGQEPVTWFTFPAAAAQAVYVRAGILYNMIAEAKEFGWFERVPEARMREVTHYGGVYGYPMKVDYMEVYYNKDAFNKLGLWEPQTLKEFELWSQKLKNTGYIPIAFGNRDRWPVTATVDWLWTLTAGKKGWDKVMFGDGKWTDKGFLEGLELLMKWVDAGFFPEGINGISYGEMGALFISGQAAMDMDGTWAGRDLTAFPKFEVDSFMLPQVKPSIPQATLAGASSVWNVSNSKPLEVKREAVKFINFLGNDDNIRTWVEEGYMVVTRKGGLDWFKYDMPHALRKACMAGDAWEEMEINGYDFHAVVPPRVAEVGYTVFQKLLEGEMSPMQTLEALQEVWEVSKKEGELWLPE